MFANEQNKHMKSERDIALDFDENTLEQYATVELQKASLLFVLFMDTFSEVPYLNIHSYYYYRFLDNPHFTKLLCVSVCFLLPIAIPSVM